MALAIHNAPSPSKQKLLFYAAENKYTANQWGQKDSSIFAISKKWFDSWRAYTESNDNDSNAPNPGPIENSRINFGYNNRNVRHVGLRYDLTEGITHEWITKSQWKLLHDWFGGGPEFGRQIVFGDSVYSIPVRHCICVRIRAIINNGTSLDIKQNVETKYFHKKTTLQHVVAHVCHSHDFSVNL